MKFVFWCSNEQRQFRLAELDAIIHMLGLQASDAIHPTFGLFSFKIKKIGLSSFKIKKVGLSSFKGGVVGEKLITALGCTEPVDGKRSKSHP